MEEILKQILNRLDSMDSSIKKLETGQKKLTKEVSEIKTILNKGAYVDIQKLERRIEVLEKKII